MKLTSLRVNKNRNRACVCGSGRKLKKCCYNILIKKS